MLLIWIRDLPFLIFMQVLSDHEQAGGNDCRSDTAAMLVYDHLTFVDRHIVSERNA